MRRSEDDNELMDVPEYEGIAMSALRDAIRDSLCNPVPGTNVARLGVLVGEVVDRALAGDDGAFALLTELILAANADRPARAAGGAARH